MRDWIETARLLRYWQSRRFCVEEFEKLDANKMNAKVIGWSAPIHFEVFRSVKSYGRSYAPSYVCSRVCVWRVVLLVVTVAAVSIFSVALPAQAPDSSGCSLPEPALGANRPNLFNEQQEQWLGDAMAGQQESNYTLLPEKNSEELTRIGNKLLAQLPPTPIHYRFRVYDSDELNGFSLAGGYVYISRKLIIDAKSEDELAGVLAHEIGHIYTHQIATAVSRAFDKMLHVTSLGGEDDVEDKYQRMLNAEWKLRSDLDESEAEKDELRADAVGLYAMVRAGYAPKAFATNLERIADSKGRNGNFLSDILGGSSPIGMRVRTARKLASATSDGCQHMQLKSSPAFLSFQQWLVSHPSDAVEDPTPGLKPMALSDPVRPGLNWVRFSPDGKYLLAQNETYVYVMSSSPLKQLFKVYAPGAGGAHFTPDSRHLVFHYQSLRVEDWDVESGTMAAAHELFEYRGCWQSELSPDGKVLACVFRNRDALQLSLELFDVATGKVVLDKEASFLPDERAQTYKILSRADWDPEVLAIAFSPDSHYLVVAAATNNFALDLSNLTPVKMRMELSGIVQGRMLFTAPDQLLYDCDAGQREIFMRAQANLCLAEFPSGVPIKKFVEGWEGMTPVAQGNYLVAESWLDSIPHLVDLTAGKPTSLLKFSASDVYGKLLASESGKGGVTVGEIGAATVQVADLPSIPLPYVRVSRISPDGQYLALSNENRGAIWDLAANRQIALTRSFRGAWFDDTGQLYLQVAAGQGKPGQNLRVDLKSGAVSDTGKYDRDRRQLLDVSVEMVRDDKESTVGKNGDLLAFDQKTGNLLWKKHFSKDYPSITQQTPGRLTLTWSMDGETAWDEITHSSMVTKTADETREMHQGWLTEEVNSQTGAVQRQVISPEGALVGWGQDPGLQQTNQSDTRSSVIYGDVVVVHGNHGNSVVYDAKTGARLMAFWGRAIAGDSKLGVIAATNRDQELMIYETATGKELAHFTLDHWVSSARFVPEKKQLVALTSNQQVYTLDITGGGVKPELQAGR